MYPLSNLVMRKRAKARACNTLALDAIVLFVLYAVPACVCAICAVGGAAQLIIIAMQSGDIRCWRMRCVIQRKRHVARPQRPVITQTDT